MPSRFRARYHSLLIVALAIAAPAHPLSFAAPPVTVDSGGSCVAPPGIATLADANGVEVVWDDNALQLVRGRHLDLALEATAEMQTLLETSGVGSYRLEARSAGGFDLAVNVEDFHQPSDPWAVYRIRLDDEGDVAESPLRLDTPRGVLAVPATGGGTLALAVGARVVGPPGCPSFTDLLAGTFDASGTPTRPMTSIAHHVPAPRSGVEIAAQATTSGSLVAWQTCQRFDGFVIERLDAHGVRSGKPVYAPLRTQATGGLTGEFALAANGASDFALAAVTHPHGGPAAAIYVRAVFAGTMTQPIHVTSGASVSAISDLVAAPDGHYLLVFQTTSLQDGTVALRAVELDARGFAVGEPIVLSAAGEVGAAAAAASLPDGGWVVAWRARQGASAACSETVRAVELAR